MREVLAITKAFGDETRVRAVLALGALMVIGLAIIIWQPGIAMYLVNGKW